MANIFALLTVLLLAASGYLAYKNKEMYEAEISDRQTAESNLRRSQARLADEKDQRDTTIAERKGLEEDIAGLREEEEAQQKQNSSIEGQIEAKRGETEANEAKLNAVREQTAALGDLRDLAPKVNRLQVRLEEGRVEKASKESTVANLRSEINATESTIDGYKEINEAVTSKRSYFGSTSITAIYPQWGFVTLGAGNTSGVVAGSSLNVVRGGETVAKLRVRSVEAGRASADIDPESVSEDVTLMVGDRVVPADGGAAN